MSSAKEPVKLRINIAGYQGKAVSLYGAYDPENDLVFIAKVGELDGGDREGYLKITNQARDKFYDGLVGEEDIRPAIDAFFQAQSLQLLTLGKGIDQHHPANKIEREGVNASGVMYRINPDMTCAQMAVMMACLTANRQRDVAGAEDMMDMLTI